MEEESRLEAVLRNAIPCLDFVTINGADSNCRNCDWKQLIQTLDQGTFDTARYLQLVRDLGYSGPIGLQGYGIGGDVEDNLRRSMKAWKKIQGN